MSQCLYKLGDLRCIYPERHHGEHFCPSDSRDHSDGIRICVLRDRAENAERELAESRALAEGLCAQVAEYNSMRERAEKAEAQVAGCESLCKAHGAAIAEMHTILGSAIGEHVADTARALRARAEKAEAEMGEWSSAAQDYLQQIATLTAERDQTSQLASAAIRGKAAAEHHMSKVCEERDALAASAAEMREALGYAICNIEGIMECKDIPSTAICAFGRKALATTAGADLLARLAEQKAELDRIGQDKSYLIQANLANDWEDRYRFQQWKYEELQKERDALSVRCNEHATENDRLLALVAGLGATVDTLRTALEREGYVLADTGMEEK